MLGEKFLIHCWNMHNEATRSENDVTADKSFADLHICGICAKVCKNMWIDAYIYESMQAMQMYAKNYNPRFPWNWPTLKTSTEKGASRKNQFKKKN